MSTPSEPYRAVNTRELVEILGRQCSPDKNRFGYVIGPDINGRICHNASCSSMAEAKRLAARYNREFDPS